MTYAAECQKASDAFTTFLAALKAEGHDWADLSPVECATLIADALRPLEGEGQQALCNSFDMVTMGLQPARVAA